jgi:outer membrane protein
MKNKMLLLLIISSLNAHGAISLKDSFESAKRNMETIKRADAVVNQSEELKIRARAGVLPTISGVGTYTKIDPPNAAGNSPFLLTRQYTAGLRLAQPLIRGGSIAAYKLAEENILLAEYQKDATELNLYQLVINAYYNLAAAQMDVKNVEQLRKYSKDRMNDIRGRTNIGKSRKGELVEAEAQFHIAESQYQQALITLQQAEKTFEFYTQQMPDDIPLGPVPDLTESMQEYINKSMTRADLKAVQQETKVAEQRVKIANGGHYPQLDLTSNYYFDRTGVLASSKWDVGLAVIIPLYQGGGVEAGVREAVEGRRIAELRKAETFRAAERDLMINYQNIIRIQVQLKALKEALQKSEQAYLLSKKDYGYGLVTNLDVLRTLNVFMESKRSYDSLIAIAHLNIKNLEALSGVLP